MVTTEEIEKAKQTFPKFTVYVCYRGGETTAILKEGAGA